MKGNQQFQIFMNLYANWNGEILTKDLTKIKEKEELIKDINKLITELKTQQRNTQDKIIQSTISNILDMIEFMLSDMFDYRSEKVLDHAKNSKNINKDKLFAQEIEYYDRLSSVFNGLHRNRKILLRELKPIPNSKDFSTKIKPQIKHTPKVEKEISHDLFTQDLTIEEPQYEHEDSLNIMDEIVEPQSPQDQKFEDILADQSDIDEMNSNTPYSKIRILQETPSLVGTDQKIYGPFHKEDIGFIPQKNAEILIEQKRALAF